MVLKCSCKSDAHQPPDILSDGDLCRDNAWRVPQAPIYDFTSDLRVGLLLLSYAHSRIGY